MADAEGSICGVGGSIAPWAGIRVESATAWHFPWHGAALAVIIGLAAGFRLVDLGTASLTHDEALRANAAFGGEHFWGVRWLPPFRVALGWAVQHGLGRSEWLIRMPYALAGIGTVVVSYLFVRRHLDKGLALWVAAAAAGHPALVFYSRRAKVFSLETLATIVLVWAGLEVYQRRSRRALLIFAVAGLIALGFTYTASLVIAAWMPLLAYRLLRERASRTQLIRPFILTTVVLGLAGSAWYVWLSGSSNHGNHVQYQQEVLKAWPASYAPGDLASWLMIKGYGVLRFVLGITWVWSPLKWCVGTAALLAAACSGGLLWRRCRPLCLFTIILGIAFVTAGALRQWPIGEYKTATFLVPLVVLAIGCGMGQFARRMGWSASVILLAGLCVLVPAARATKASLVPQPIEQHLRPVFTYAADHLAPGDALFVHYETQFAYEFYWRREGVPTTVQPWGDRDDAAAFAAHFDSWMTLHPRVWFVFNLRRPSEVGPWMEHLRQRYLIQDEYRSNDAAVYLIEHKTAPGE
ncbi:MAG: hypothetical protein GY842_13895 [bacterium]|nr:hypothetical protein [bacterium]